MSLQNNSVHVDSATPNMSIGQVDDIKKKAMQQVTVAEQTQREAQTNLKSNAPEGNVYGALAAEIVAPGASAALNVLGFLDARREDKLGSTASGVETSGAKPIDDFIQDAAKPNGFFAAIEQEPAAFDMFAANSPRAPLKVFDGGKSTAMDVFEKASVASCSLKDNDPINLKSWDIPPKKQQDVQEAKKTLALTYDQKMANETAFNSALVVERQQAAMIYQANQMVPGLGSKMASGPDYSPRYFVKRSKINSRFHKVRHKI